MARLLRVLVAIAALLLVPPPAVAEEREPSARDKAEEMAREAERLARDAGERLMAILRLMLATVPQYEAPEILDNGDIIIRRKHPTPPPPAPPADVDETNT